MAVEKKKPDPTGAKRVARAEKNKRENGLVPVSTKAWVRADKEQEAREILTEAKRKAEAL
jgi:hypothetical protein